MLWLHVVMRVCDVTVNDLTTRRVICINQMIDDEEARAVRAEQVVVRAPSPLDVGLLGGGSVGFLDGLFDGGRAAGTKRMAATDEWGCGPVKMARHTDGMFEDVPASLMSMPSPPLSHGGGFLDPPVGGAVKAADSGQLLSISSYPDVSMTGVKSEVPYVTIPDSFLTPNASPCSFTSSPAPTIPEFNPTLEETSFFDGGGGGARQTDAIKRSMIAELPELDLPTVTSYLHCLEQSAQRPQTASFEYSTALSINAKVDVALNQPETTSTIDEELLQNLFSTAHSFLSSVSAAKPFELYSGNNELLFAHC